MTCAGECGVDHIILHWIDQRVSDGSQGVAEPRPASTELKIAESESQTDDGSSDVSHPATTLMRGVGSRVVWKVPTWAPFSLARYSFVLSIEYEKVAKIIYCTRATIL